MKLGRKKGVGDTHGSSLGEIKEDVLIYLSVEGGRILHVLEIWEELLESAGLGGDGGGG